MRPGWRRNENEPSAAVTVLATSSCVRYGHGMLYRSTLTGVTSPLTRPDKVTGAPAGTVPWDAEREMWGCSGDGVAASAGVVGAARQSPATTQYAG